MDSVATRQLPAARHSVERTYLDPKSLSFRARKRRFKIIRTLIERIVARKGTCRIADIGGTEYYWEIGRDFISQVPVKISLINLEHQPTRDPIFESLKGDGCDLSNFEDNSFDLVHANSVIEHVGNWDRCMCMAHHVRRLAPSYYIQTPNFWFPYEPHFRFPLFQFFPEPVRFRLLMHLNLVFGGRRETVDAAMRGVQSAQLLDRRQLQALFPDAIIHNERFGPLTKSLMAVRQA